MDVAWSSLS